MQDRHLAPVGCRVLVSLLAGSPRREGAAPARGREPRHGQADSCLTEAQGGRCSLRFWMLASWSHSISFIFLAGSFFFFLFSFLVLGSHLKNTPYTFSTFTPGSGQTDLGGNLEGCGHVVSARQTVIISTETALPPCVPLHRGGPTAPIRTENYNVHSYSEQFLLFTLCLPSPHGLKPRSPSRDSVTMLGQTALFSGFPVYCVTPGLFPVISPQL